jgi:PTS system glucose-specific IIA component
MHSVDFGWAIFMKGHATMGFFSRLMGGSDKQATATSEFEILAPVSGELVNLENTNDPAFSSRAAGDGVAVVPQEGTVCAPVSGTVAALFPTEHALGIMSDDSSAQVMLHIGIDTVKLEGKGFHALVAQGDHVDAGQPLVEVDFDAVRAAGFDPTVFVIVCERSENSTLREHASGPVAVKEPVVWLSE